MKHDTVLSLRIRQDKMSRVQNYADMLLKVKRDKKSTEKNDADLLLRVR